MCPPFRETVMMDDYKYSPIIIPWIRGNTPFVPAAATVEVVVLYI